MSFCTSPSKSKESGQNKSVGFCAAKRRPKSENDVAEERPPRSCVPIYGRLTPPAGNLVGS
jgi:hypothetical protein